MLLSVAGRVVVGGPSRHGACCTFRYNGVSKIGSGLSGADEVAILVEWPSCDAVVVVSGWH